MLRRSFGVVSLAGLAVLASMGSLAARQRPLPQDHPEDYPRADVEYGARLYTSHCTGCHGAAGDGVANADLRSGRFRNAGTDNQLRGLISNGFPTAGMPAFRLDAAELTGLVAYLRNMNAFDPASSVAGDPVRGKGLFEGKGACLSCHRVDHIGSRKGPDLSDVGAMRSAGAIERSLRDQNSQMLPINRPVRLLLRDGRTIDGRRLNEDTYSVQIVDEEGRLISVVKADLREMKVSPTSPMPSYAQVFTAQESADVVAYMLSLKGR